MKIKDIKECFLCARKLNNFGRHLRVFHKTSTKEYYDKYFKKESEGICFCGKETKFIALNYGYRRNCSQVCRSQENWSNDCFKKNHFNGQSRASNKMWADDAVIEKMQNRKNNSLNGYYFSIKSNAELFYQSSYELQAYEILEQLDEVKYFNRCKFSIDYIKPEDNRLHKYIPDIEVIYKSGNRQIIEVKSEWQLEDEIVKAKASAATEKFGDDYIVWTEKNLGLTNEN